MHEARGSAPTSLLLQPLPSAPTRPSRPTPSSSAFASAPESTSLPSSAFATVPAPASRPALALSSRVAALLSPPPAAPPAPPAPVVATGFEATVIIPCRGRVADLLMQQLHALAAQDFEGSWELLIVDNRIADDLSPLLTQYGPWLPNARVITAADRPGRGYAINQAVAQAKSPLLIMLDSDDVVFPSYLREAVAALGRHDFVGTRLDSVWLNPGWLQTRRRPLQETQLERMLGHRRAVIGAGMALTRSAFDRAGGFDEDLLVLEDLDLSFRLQQLGVQPFFASAAVVRYRYRKGWWAILQQERLYSRGEALLHRKHRGALARRRLRQTAGGWRDVLVAVPRLLTRGGRARMATALGAALGRVEGSVRYRVLHL